jgi:hypothetical protein
MSYLLFTSKYTSALIDIGYNDAGKRIDEIESILYSDDGSDCGAPRENARVRDKVSGQRPPAAGGSFANLT